MIEILTGGLLVSLALVARRWTRERTRRREGRRPEIHEWFI